ncbi:hypothetical protein RhiLY_03019 [Ceratobasidium sp. AG-Ba]|nr:hypothetical protein RhiLY_03019 [Ceratobasidium sp. AG-Ba]
MPPKPASPRPSSAAGPSNDAQWPEPQRNQDAPQSTTIQTSLPDRPVAGPPIEQPQTSMVVKQPDRSSTVPVAPVILRAPKHAIRYQLADPPVPKLQPIPKSDPTNLGSPLNSVPNYRAVLKPVSAPRPASPIKPIPPRINQKGMSDQAATISVPPPSNPLSKTSTPMSTSVTLPELGPGPEPGSLTQRDTRSTSQPSLPLPRRSHSPQRPRPQAQSQPPALRETNQSFGITPNPQSPGGFLLSLRQLKKQDISNLSRPGMDLVLPLNPTWLRYLFVGPFNHKKVSRHSNVKNLRVPSDPNLQQ